MPSTYNLIIITAAALPCLLIIRWIIRYDAAKPEPRLLILKLFGLGLLTPLIAALIEMFSIPLCELLPSAIIVPAQAFLGIALVEESVKLAAMVLILRRRQEFDELLDGAVFGITAAMSFALVENIIYVWGASDPLRLALLRGITAVPLHALAGGLMGLAWARFKIESKGSVGEALLIAVLIHGAYDWVLMDTRVNALLIWPILLSGWTYFLIVLHRARREDRAAGRMF